ncbi:MAG: hypothetical protein M3N29_02620, partial [Chloroflexota bacterium]|nr:hypothetical protein [Chloroflexota bacterium]
CRMSDDGHVRPRRRARDRDVLLLTAAIVLAVLAVRAAGELVPGIDYLVAVVPLVIVGLALATVVVLVRALRPRRDR